LRKAAEVRHAEHGLVRAVAAIQVAEIGEDLAVRRVQKVRVPRPKTWNSLRSAIMLRVQCNRLD
jgi:hypothetical protein